MQNTLNGPADKYYPLGSLKEPSMGNGYSSNYNQGTASSYRTTAPRNSWSSEARSIGNNRDFNRNDQNKLNDNQYFNAPSSNYQSATYARSDDRRLNDNALPLDYSMSPGYVESAYPASNYQSADKWNSFSQLGSNDNTYRQYDSSAQYYQQQQQTVTPLPRSKKDYYPIGKETGMPSSSYNDNVSTGGSFRNDNRSYRSPMARSNRPGASPSDQSSGTIYYPLQPDYSAHLDPGRSKYNVKDNRRQYYNTEDEPYYQPRPGYGSSWGDAPSSSRFTYRVPYKSQRDRDGRDTGRDTRRRENDRDDNDFSPGWLRWLRNLGRM
jgi:hypothetical protein